MGGPEVDVWSFEDIALVLERELTIDIEDALEDDIALVLERELAVDIEDALNDDMLGWLPRELDKVALTDWEMLLTDVLPDELDTTPVLE
jgi:hypothetical protein